MEDLTRCPQGHRLDTLESRHRVIGETRTIWRRKRCSICHHQITTCEVPADLAKEIFSDD